MPDDNDRKLPPTEVYPTPEDFNYKKPPVALTFERKMRYLYELRRTGLMYRAAELVGVSSSVIDNARKKEPEFAAAVLEAKNRFVDEVLITEAHRRAVKGVERPIIGGRYRDEVVATEVVYSDSLLSLLLKSQRPEFREGGGSDPSRFDQGQPGVVVIPTAPQTPEDWEQQCGESANPKSGDN
jgi:hypothetical protein